VARRHQQHHGQGGREASSAEASGGVLIHTSFKYDWAGEAVEQFWGVKTRGAGIACAARISYGFSRGIVQMICT
jgi:hypothetical protein